MVGVLYQEIVAEAKQTFHIGFHNCPLCAFEKASMVLDFEESRSDLSMASSKQSKRWCITRIPRDSWQW